jgi:putative oxidoreductase
MTQQKKEKAMSKYVDLLARILMAAIFVMAGISKISGYAGTQSYMASQGVPGMLLPLVIALELGGGLLLIAGWKTRYIAFALAGFSIIAGVIFHSNFSDHTQSIMFMKNLAMAGGLLLLSVHGAGGLSLDARTRK